MLSFVMPAAVELLTWMGVGGCGWPILWRVVRRIRASFMLVKRPAVSALAAEETTTLITPVGFKIEPLHELLFLLPR